MALIESAFGQFVLQYAARKAVDAGLGHLLHQARAHLQNPFVKRVSADKYLTLSSLGLVRELLRGGEPDFHFYARTAGSFRDVCVAYRQAESCSKSKALNSYDFYSDQVRNNDNSKFTFPQNVQKILKETGHSANLTFVAGTLLTSQHALRIVSAT